jgi:hypothetical protein
MSVVGAARAMIHDQGLPLVLWAEASSAAIYLQNRSPYTILGKHTPEETFSGAVYVTVMPLQRRVLSHSL